MYSISHIISSFIYWWFIGVSNDLSVVLGPTIRLFNLFFKFIDFIPTYFIIFF